jgi:hemerythrin-like domain-containing protein
MAVQLGEKPLADFTQPIEMLTDCHRRIEHFLDVLQRVDELFGDRDLDAEGRRALKASLDYFANAAPRHTRDEEESLFPRLRSSGGAGVREALAELDRLERDHRRAEVCHARVDEIVRSWLAAGRLDAACRAEIRELLDELATTYATHIHVEEERVFVLAARTLRAEELQEIGAEMRHRRLAGHPARPDRHKPHH